MSARLLALTIAWSILASALLGEGAPQKVVFIVAAASHLRILSLRDAKIYFELKHTSGPDGSPITIAMREPGPERETVLALVLKKSDADLNRYFMQAVFTGAIASAPKTVIGAAATKHFVAGTPGAIGYIMEGDLDDSVHALAIDGIQPSSPTYPLVVGAK